MVINILTNILIFIFIFLTSFLTHELMHIKSQGLRMHGVITVNDFGMTCSAQTITNRLLFALAGGLYTSIIMFIMVFCSTDFWQWSFLTFGYMHLIYGLYEGFIGIKYRMYIYVTVICVMLSLWMVK